MIRYAVKLKVQGVGWTKVRLLFALSSAFFFASWLARSGSPAGVSPSTPSSAFASSISSATLMKPRAFAPGDTRRVHERRASHEARLDVERHRRELCREHVRHVLRGRTQQPGLELVVGCRVELRAICVPRFRPRAALARDQLSRRPPSWPGRSCSTRSRASSRRPRRGTGCRTRRTRSVGPSRRPGWGRVDPVSLHGVVLGDGVVAGGDVLD